LNLTVQLRQFSFEQFFSLGLNIGELQFTYVQLGEQGFLGLVITSGI
jgi:hypothetical protein